MNSIILNKLLIFLKIKKNWKKPIRAKIIIYDHLLSKYFEKYIAKEDYVIYHNRFTADSEINIFVILKCFLNFDFKLKSYKKIFFTYVSPKIVITMFDNNPGFFRLKKEFPNLITVAIQKAWKFDVQFDLIYQRHNKKDLNYECDYYFCYNKFIAEIFSQFIKMKKIFVIGSFLSNSNKIKKKQKDYIVYISQWRNYRKEEIFHKKLSFGDWQKNEKSFLLKLFKFVNENNLNLKILGKTNLTNYNEKLFYNDIFGENYEFIDQHYYRDHYTILDNAKLTVTLDSTLGYENLARGNKTIFFLIRNNKKMDFDMIRFCWPERKSETGPNWTNSLSKDEFNRLFSIIDLPDLEWKKIYEKNFKETLIYDHNNSKFVNFLKKYS